MKSRKRQQQIEVCELLETKRRLVARKAFQSNATITFHHIFRIILSVLLSASTNINYHPFDKFILLINSFVTITSTAAFCKGIVANNNNNRRLFCFKAPLLTHNSRQSFWEARACSGRRHPFMSYPPIHGSTSTSSPGTTAITGQQSLSPEVVARFVSASSDSLKQCGERIRKGHLVSFPTETVYGLGCHALDSNAVAKVFAAKERPYSDPLIVHVCDITQALSLWDLGGKEEVRKEKLHVLQLLCRTFWPGPLTIVAPADVSKVPQTIMANTSHVAIRYPSHRIAQLLIQYAGVPIAAPSANKFGHVSPTRPEHVMCDLGMEDVWVIDPAINNTSSNNNSNIDNNVAMQKKNHDDESSLIDVCQVGVESTVIKLDFVTRTIELLRHGAVSKVDLESCIMRDAELSPQKNGLEIGMSNGVSNVVGSRYLVIDNMGKKPLSSMNESANNLERMSDQGHNDDGTLLPHVAPGQAIRHYSPNVLSYMISPHRYKALVLALDKESLLSAEETDCVSKSVIVDFGGKLKSLQPYCLGYQDLSAEGDAQEGASRVFEVLRWSEAITGAQRVYFPQLLLHSENPEITLLDDQESTGLLLALKDRLTRAASGVVIDSFQ